MGRAYSLPSPPRYAPGGRRRFGAGQSPAPKPKARPGAKAPGRAFAGAPRPRRPPGTLRSPALSWPILSRSSPGTASISYTPYAVPHPFPSVTHHTPKAFWKPPKAVSKAEPFAALGEAPLTPFASPGEAHAPSALHFRPATSQGSGGGAAPSRGSRGAAAPGLGGANAVPSPACTQKGPLWGGGIGNHRPLGAFL